MRASDRRTLIIAVVAVAAFLLFEARVGGKEAVKESAAYRIGHHLISMYAMRCTSLPKGDKEAYSACVRQVEEQLLQRFEVPD